MQSAQPVMLGVRFLLKAGHFVAVGMPEDEANKYVQDWLSGEMMLRARQRIGGISTEGYQWAVDVSEIQAIHTFDIAEAVAAQMGQGVPRRLPPTSGAQSWTPPPGPGFPKK